MIKLLEEVATIHNYLQKRVYIRSRRHIKKKKKQKKEAEGKIDVFKKNANPWPHLCALPSILLTPMQKNPITSNR